MDSLYPDLYSGILELLDMNDWIHFRYTCKDIYNSVTNIDIQDKMKEKMDQLEDRLWKYEFRCDICDTRHSKRSINYCCICESPICGNCINDKCRDQDGTYVSVCNDCLHQCDICSCLNNVDTRCKYCKKYLCHDCTIYCEDCDLCICKKCNSIDECTSVSLCNECNK